MDRTHSKLIRKTLWIIRSGQSGYSTVLWDGIVPPVQRQLANMREVNFSNDKRVLRVYHSQTIARSWIEMYVDMKKEEIFNG